LKSLFNFTFPNSTESSKIVRDSAKHLTSQQVRKREAVQKAEEIKDLYFKEKGI
jgi:hypothetical protein